MGIRTHASGTRPSGGYTCSFSAAYLFLRLFVCSLLRSFGCLFACLSVHDCFFFVFSLFLLLFVCVPFVCVFAALHGHQNFVSPVKANSCQCKFQCCSICGCQSQKPWRYQCCHQFMPIKGMCQHRLDRCRKGLPSYMVPSVITGVSVLLACLMTTKALVQSSRRENAVTGSCHLLQTSNTESSLHVWTVHKMHTGPHQCLRI